MWHLLTLAALGYVVAIEQRGRVADMASSGGIAAGSGDSISKGGLGDQTCVVGMDNMHGEGDGSDGNGGCICVDGNDSDKEGLRQLAGEVVEEKTSLGLGGDCCGGGCSGGEGGGLQGLVSVAVGKFATTTLLHRWF